MRLNSERIQEIRRSLMGRTRKAYGRWFKHLHWSQDQIQDWLEQVSTDGLIEAREDLARWDPEKGSLDQWCWLKTKTIARDRLRKTTRRDELLESFVAETKTQPYSYDPIESLIQHQSDCRELKEASQILTEDQKEVLGLYYVRQLAVPRIARIIGCEIKTVYTILDRGRKRLRVTIKSMRSREADAETKLERRGNRVSLPQEERKGHETRPPPVRVKAKEEGRDPFRGEHDE